MSAIVNCIRIASFVETQFVSPQKLFSGRQQWRKPKRQRGVASCYNASLTVGLLPSALGTRYKMMDDTPSYRNKKIYTALEAEVLPRLRSEKQWVQL